MSLHLLATVELFPGKIGPFRKTLKQIVPIMGSAGMKLAGSWLHTIGTLHTVTDLWELEDLHTQPRAIAAMVGHPTYPELAKSLEACVQRETLVYLEPFLERRNEPLPRPPADPRAAPGGPTYLNATIQVVPGKLAQFKETLEEVVRLMEGQGWRLLGSWHHATGFKNTVTDLWEIDDANRYASARAALAGNAEIRRSLDECVQGEKRDLMTVLLNAGR